MPFIQANCVSHYGLPNNIPKSYKYGQTPIARHIYTLYLLPVVVFTIYGKQLLRLSLQATRNTHYTTSIEYSFTRRFFPGNQDN